MSFLGKKREGEVDKGLLQKIQKEQAEIARRVAILEQQMEVLTVRYK